MESLLREELESVRDSVRGGRARQSVKSLAERASAEDLVRDQYAGRYPFELIQNANDAGVDRVMSGGTVAFTLTNTALIVADQGTGFGVDQVEAICGFANSSKDPRKSIGYKGLGFKSVKEITSAPQIFAPDVQFGFDGPRAQHLVREVLGEASDLPAVPYYAFPFPITPNDAGEDRDVVVNALGEGFRTVIRLPFRSDVSREMVDQTLADTLHPQVLLFLDHLDRLVVSGTSEDFEASVERDDDGDYSEVLLDCNGALEHFLVFRTERKIPDQKLVADLGGAWEKVGAVRLFAAVPLAEDGLPQSEGSEFLHVYFPTEEDSGLAFILNADFQLDAARLRIASAPNTVGYNEWLTDELASLVAQTVVPALLGRFDNHPRVAAAVLYPEPAGAWPKRLRARLVQLLAESAFVPCVDGGARSPQDVRLLPSSVRDVAFFQTLLPDEVERLVHAAIDANVSEREVLQRDFAVEELDGEETFANLNPPEEEMVTRFYEALVAWWKEAPSWEDAWLEKARCVRLEGGGWATPRDAFLAPQRGEHHLPTGVPLPIADLPEVPDAEAMLKSAGLKTFGWRTVIIDYLVPILTNPDETDAKRADALKLLRDYHGSDRHDASVQKEVGAILLQGNNIDGSKQALVPARHLYFGGDWMADSDLTVLYGPFNYAEFLAEPLPDESDARAGEFAFFSWLGVEEKPRIYDLRSSETKDPLPDYSAPSRHLDLAWRGTPGFQNAATCRQGHPKSQLLRSSPWIDRLDAIMDRKDFAELSTLWNVIARHWGHYAEALHAEFSCAAAVHRGLARRRFQSLVGYAMATIQWVPTLENDERWLVLPDSLWHLPDDAPASLAGFLPTLAPQLLSKRAMCDALGVVDGKQPGAEDLIELLHRLNDESNEAQGRVTASATDIARWTMRKLDSVAQDIPSDEAANIPLLARLDGSPVFDACPYVASDRLAEEALQGVVPIYDGDRTARNLPNVLKLPVLDEQVSIEARIVGRDPIAESQTISSFEAVLPQLLAAAAQLAPSLQVEISQKLNGLKISCVQELSLRYQLGDEIRTANAPTSYIRGSGEHHSSAYLALDRETGAVDWYSFAAQLARHLDVEEAADCFAILLTNPRGRSKYLAARGISDADITAAQQSLSDHPVPAEIATTGDAPAVGTDVTESERGAESEPANATDEESQGGLPSIAPAEGAALQQQLGESRGEGAMAAKPDGDRAFEDVTRVPTDGPGPSIEMDRSRPSVDERTAARTSYGDGSKQISPGIEAQAVKQQKRSTGRSPAAGLSGIDEHRPQGRFFSYVLPGGGSYVDSADPGESISPDVDRAGVDRVLAYEREAGRDPREQSHNNPGFDVASHDPDGSVVRYIEIKSLVGRWAERGVAMSRRQAAENVDRGNDFWLYVVEYAMDDARATIYPIHDPMSKASSFVFDGGWSAHSELEQDT